MNHITKELILFLGAVIMATIDLLDRIVSCRTYTKKEQTEGIRLNKVQNTRCKLKSGKYDLGERLSIALDRLIEEVLE